ALGNGPARERAVALEAEVVVEPPRVVPLDDEDRLLRLAPLTGERLRGLLRVALTLVLGEAGHLGSFALPRAPALALLLRPFHGLAERCHQVEDLTLLGLLARRRGLAGLGLLLQQREQLLPVCVVVLLGIEGVAQVLHERSGHLDLRLPELGLPVDGLRLPDLVREVHRLEEQRAFPWTQRREVLFVAD